MSKAVKLGEPIQCDCCGKMTGNGWRDGHRKSCYPCAMTCWANQSRTRHACQIMIVDCEKGHTYKTRQTTSTTKADVCTVCCDRINERLITEDCPADQPELEAMK